MAGALVGARPAPAGEWRVTPSVGVTESFSDNANLAADDEDRNSDFISVLSPGVSVRGSGGRINLDFDYSLEKTYHLRDTEADALRNNLLGRGEIELWERVAFLNAQASVSREVVSGDQPTSASVAGRDVNRATVRTISVTPSLRHHFGTWVETESSITVNQVSTDTSELDDTMQTVERFHANGGRRFTVLNWSLDLSNSKLASSGEASAVRRRLADANFTYVLGPKLSLLAGVGWQRVQAPDLDEQPRGLTWNVGFDARPGRLTSLRFTVGDRDETTTVNASANHQFSPRTSISASYTETIQTTQEQLAQNLGFLVVDPLTGELIDSRTGQPFVAGDDTFGLEPATFRQQRLTVSLSGSRRRTTFGANLFWERREFESDNREETAFGGGMNLGRQLSPRLNSGLSLSLNRTDPGGEPSQVETEGALGATLSYRFARDVRASLAYNLTVRNVTNSDDDLRENAVTLSLRKAF